MKRVVNPLIGSDIELFLMHKDTREIVSAEGYIPGTKHNPFNFDTSNRFFALSLDNVAAEFNIPPVNPNDKEKFWEYIQKAVNYINNVVPSHLCTIPLPAAVLDDKYLQTENARLFGCSPDYNVWTREVNPKPSATDQNLRSAGGHIHIGHDHYEDQETNEMLIKALDLTIGVPSVLQEPDNKRKELYGKAGCFRFTDYGVEYRTLSNYFVADKKLADWVLGSALKAIDLVNSEFPFDDYGERIQTAINQNDKVVAENLINELELEMA